MRTEDPVSQDGRLRAFLTTTTDLRVSDGERRGGLLYRKGGKRVLDLCLAAGVILIFSPILLSVWLSLRVTLGSGVLLRQERVGKDGSPFTLLKFRTMDNCRRKGSWLPSGRVDRRLTHKSARDPRHTRLGRVFRKFSFDELPQLFNVLAGDMSLVGPRPELHAQASEDFRSHVRHDVRPGLTGPFQVSDLRGTGDLSSGLALDERYVQTLSFKHDLELLRGTLAPLVNGSGS